MSKRLILIPRWAGTPKSDWYPWLERELAKSPARSFDPVVMAAMPHPELPTIEEWVPRVQSLVGSEPELAARTVVAAHSVGCQAVLRALAGMSSGTRVDGLLFVAGWFHTDEPWPSLMPWIETPLDLAKVKAAAGKIVVVISDNDHHRSDWRSNRLEWEDRLGAAVVLVSGADHFNGVQYPEILQSLAAFAGKEDHVSR